MKNNIEYFGHQVDSLDHRKFLILRAHYGGDKGWAMEARFWGLNCLIGKAADCKLDLSLKGEKARVARALELSLAELDEFILVLKDDAELIQIDDGKVWTQKTQEDLERAIAVRIESQNRRKRNDGRQSADDPKTTADISKTTADKNHLGNAMQGNTSLVNSACSEPPAAAAILPEVVDKSLAGFPPAARIPLADRIVIAQRLSDLGLDAGFLAYCIKRTEEGRPRNPGGFLRSALLGSHGFEDYPETYRAEHKAPTPTPARTPAPRVCELCGEPLRLMSDEAICAACGASWVYDSAFEIWAKSNDTYVSLSDLKMSG